ncbi:hypothetical protein [Amaricoccus sp. W119]|uniref:hypothetical protein n=1 Tax=Amaricoccus sp. W119 TaxID=3391833 RepID=UPI0039A4445B
MKLTLPIVASALALSFPVAAMAESAENIAPEIDVMRRIASAYDENGDDKISVEEFREFTRTVWRSMDTNASGSVEREEFMLWDPGFSHAAEMKGELEDYTELKGHVFDYWDQDDDGIATREEVIELSDAEFATSDSDGDGFVTGRDLAFGSPTFAAFIFGAGPATE